MIMITRAFILFSVLWSVFGLSVRAQIIGQPIAPFLEIVHWDNQAYDGELQITFSVEWADCIYEAEFELNGRRVNEDVYVMPGINNYYLDYKERLEVRLNFGSVQNMIRRKKDGEKLEAKIKIKNRDKQLIYTAELDDAFDKLLYQYNL